MDKVARDDESRDVGAVWRRVATTVAVFVEQCPRGITRNKKNVIDVSPDECNASHISIK